MYSSFQEKKNEKILALYKKVVSLRPQNNSLLINHLKEGSVLT